MVLVKNLNFLDSFSSGIKDFKKCFASILEKKQAIID